jgi:hypothetical protein
LSIIGASIIVWLNTRALENWDWKKRVQTKERHRRIGTVVLWCFGLMTSLVPMVSCYEPETIYEIVHSQVPLFVDVLATFECFYVGILMVRCSSVSFFDKVGCIVGLSGCIFSLLSSVGGLGSIANGLVHISAWYFGAMGFCVATLPRSFVVSLLMKFWGWAKAKFAHPTAAQREEIAL